MKSNQIQRKAQSSEATPVTFVFYFLVSTGTDMEFSRELPQSLTYGILRFSGVPKLSLGFKFPKSTQ